jgi:hypothetical protein
MFNYIKKFVNGGSIDVDALRKDVKSDPRFYDKKSGVFTRSGKERLAAIEEINTVQEQGYKYKIYDDNTFDIVDKSEKVVDPIEGRGVEVGRKVGPFYGMINKERRSKKEVSTILGGLPKTKVEEVKKDEIKSDKKDEVNSDKKDEVNSDNKLKIDPTKRDQNLTANNTITSTNTTTVDKTIPASSTTNATADKTSESKDKKVETEVTKAGEKVKAREENIKNKTNKDNANPAEVVLPSDNTQQTSNTATENKTEKDNKVKESKKEEISEPYTFTQYEKTFVDEYGLENVLNDVDDRSENEKDRELERYKVIKSIIDFEPSSDFNMNLQNQNKKMQKENLARFKDNEVKKTAKKLLQLQKIFKEYEENMPDFSNDFKEKIIPALRDKQRNLENKRDQYNKLDFKFLKQDLEDFINSKTIKIPTKKHGGLVISGYRLGGPFVYKHQFADGDEVYPSLRESSLKPNKYGVYKIDNFYQNEEGIETDEFGNTLSDLIENPADKKTEKNTGNKRTLADEEKEKKEKEAAFIKQRKEANAAKRKELATSLGNALNNSPIQLFDLLQAGLIYKNWKNPVTKVEAAQDIYRPLGVRNVMAARDIDASMLQAAEKNKVRSGYRGSDWQADMIGKQLANVENAKLRQEVIMQRAKYRGEEALREFNDTQARQQDQNTNIANETAVINLNNREKQRADLLNAQELQRRDSELLSNIGLLGQQMQTRLNNTRETNKQFEAGIQAKNIEALTSSLYNEYELATKNLENIKYRLQSKTALTEEDKKDLQDAYNAKTEAQKAYANHKATLEEQIRTAKTKADRTGYFS